MDQESPNFVHFMTLIAEGDKLYNNGQFDEALEFYTQALDLDPQHKRGLVARSKCHLIKGNVEAALKDAELSLANDKLFFRGLYQKAEALYQKGDFEMALVYYHRGHKIRPELTIFNLGIQKASEAIINSVGSPGTGLNQKTCQKGKSCGGGNNATCNKPQSTLVMKGISQTDKFSDLKCKRSTGSNFSKTGTGSGDAGNFGSTNRSVVKCTKAQKNLLGELFVDKEYLESLEKDIDLMESAINPKESSQTVGDLVYSGIDFLTYKTEFWRQQKPLYARKLSTSNIPPASDPVNDTLKIIDDLHQDEVMKLGAADFIKALKVAENEVSRIERCTEKQLQQAAIRAGSPLVSKNILIAELCLQIGAICLRKYQGDKEDCVFKKAEANFMKVYTSSSKTPRTKTGETEHYTSQQDNALDRLGRLYVLKNDLISAIKTWEKREVILSDNKYELVVLYHDIGRAYLTLKDYKKANEYAHLSYTMVVDSVWKMNVMVLLAEIHLACKEIDKAKHVLENCLAIAKDEKDVGAEKAVTDLLDRLRVRV